MTMPVQQLFSAENSRRQSILWAIQSLPDIIFHDDVKISVKIVGNIPIVDFDPKPRRPIWSFFQKFLG